jgi:hypothetical protein
MAKKTKGISISALLSTSRRGILAAQTVTKIAKKYPINDCQRVIGVETQMRININAATILACEGSEWIKECRCR